MTTTKQRAALVSVGSNIILVIAKLIVGTLAGSVSILSEAIHSANDLLAAIVAWWSVRLADQPPDDKHPYGHGKVESISGALEAGLIITAGIWIIVEASRKLINPTEIGHVGIGTIVMLSSAAINFVVSQFLYRVAREQDSLALRADAAHLSTDVFTSLAVSVGLILVHFTNWHIIDPLIAIAVALILIWTGGKLIRDAGAHLMDERLPDRELESVCELLDAEKRILSWHELRTRRAGSQRQIDVHIVVESNSTLSAAHAIANDLERLIEDKLRPAHVVIHVDPSEGMDPPRNWSRSGQIDN